LTNKVFSLEFDPFYDLSGGTASNINDTNVKLAANIRKSRNFQSWVRISLPAICKQPWASWDGK